MLLFPSVLRLLLLLVLTLLYDFTTILARLFRDSAGASKQRLARTYCYTTILV